MPTLDELKYPIGKFNFPGHCDPLMISEWISELEAFPAALAGVVGLLSPEQLDTSYRSGGWTVRQVIHHLADSHINAYTRVKLVLTEDNPMVKPYQEALWAELPEAKHSDVHLSIAILKGVHSRMTATLRALEYAAFERTYRHPEFTGPLSLAFLTGTYAWHGRHHLAQVKLVL